jgi:hypothetical protein
MTPTNALVAGRNYGGTNLFLPYRFRDPSSSLARHARPRRAVLRRVAAMIPRLPADVWCAIGVAIALPLFGMIDPTALLAVGYAAGCAYVLFCVFGSD